MFFVIDKPQFQRIISIVRDDRTKETRGLAGPFLRLEAREDYVKLDGVTVSAKIPATVYEPGVLFLKVTLFRKLLQTLKGEKFLSIQATADQVLMGNVRLPLESNEMLLYVNPERAPQVHPSATLPSSGSASKPQPTPQYYPSWLIWNKPDTEPDKPAAGGDVAPKEQEKIEKQTATTKARNDRIQTGRDAAPKARAQADAVAHKVIKQTEAGEKAKCDRIVQDQKAVPAHEPPVRPEIEMEGERKKVDPVLRIATVLLVLAAAGVLIGASGKHSYSYFSLLRWLACLAAVLLVCRGTVQGIRWAWAIAPLAILFNPVAPVHFSRDAWQALDIAAAIVMVLCVAVMETASLLGEKR